MTQQHLLIGLTQPEVHVEMHPAAAITTSEHCAGTPTRAASAPPVNRVIQQHLVQRSNGPARH